MVASGNIQTPEQVRGGGGGWNIPFRELLTGDSIREHTGTRAGEGEVEVENW